MCWHWHPQAVDELRAALAAKDAYQAEAAKAWTKLTESQEQEIEQLKADLAITAVNYDSLRANCARVVEASAAKDAELAMLREAAGTLVGLFVWEPNEETGEVEPHLDQQTPHLYDALTKLRAALAAGDREEENK